MASSRVPVVLSEVPSSDLDRELQELEFPAVWQRYEPLVRKLIVKAVGRMSLHKAEAVAGSAGHVDLAGVSSVRRALADQATFVDDAAQEVAIALLEAVRRRAVRASAPAIEAWFRTAVPRIVQRIAREQAVLLFGSGELEPEGDQSRPATGSVPGHRSAIPCPEVATAFKRQVEGIRALARTVLKPRELAIVEAWLEDRDHAEIAALLGLKPQHVRLILFRAIAALRRAVGAPELGSAAGPRGTARVRLPEGLEMDGPSEIAA